VIHLKRPRTPFAVPPVSPTLPVGNRNGVVFFHSLLCCWVPETQGCYSPVNAQKLVQRRKGTRFTLVLKRGTQKVPCPYPSPEPCCTGFWFRARHPFVTLSHTAPTLNPSPRPAPKPPRDQFSSLPARSPWFCVVPPARPHPRPPITFRDGSPSAPPLHGWEDPLPTIGGSRLANLTPPGFPSLPAFGEPATAKKAYSKPIE